MPRSSSQRFQPSQPSQPSPPSPSSQTSQSSPSSEPSQGPPPSPSDLASVLRTGPFHLALRTALSIRGSPCTACSSTSPSAECTSG